MTVYKIDNLAKFYKVNMLKHTIFKDVDNKFVFFF